MIKIDSHQHFWKVDRGDYFWLKPELSELYRDFIPEHLSDALEKTGISKTILVQAANTVEETLYMLELANLHPFIAGVVGWVDMASADAEQQIKSLAQDSKFKGIRPMLQDIEDTDWMLKPELAKAFTALIENGLTFDALVQPRHLPNLLTLARRYPKLKIVIDHSAKPVINGSVDDAVNQAWLSQMASLAACPNVYCKLSGLLTEAGANPVYDKVKPYMAHLLQCFSPERLMWGSDWPVVNLAADYQSWHDMTEAFVASLTARQQQSIWAGTAQQFYQI